MARDRFTQQLKCPQCGRMGIAHLSQEDGWGFVKGNTATDVDGLSEGFRSVDTSEPRPEIRCTECDVPAVKP